MKKSLILTLVFAVISFSGAFAQTINRPAPTQKPKLERKSDKVNPPDVRPGSETPNTRPSDKKRVEKGDNGKHKGHKKGKGHTKNHKGKAKGHHKHDHEAQSQEHQGRSKGKARKNDQSSKMSEKAPKGRKAQKQSGQK